MINDQQLQALIDNELDAEERELLFREAATCHETAHRLCDYLHLRDQVRHAYSPISIPIQLAVTDTTSKRQPLLVKTMAAASVLALGCLLGALFSQSNWPITANNPGFTNQHSVANLPVSSTTASGIILHVNSNKIEIMDAALSRAEMLIAAKHAGATPGIEVVTNLDGIDLLRKDKTPFADRVSRLASQNVVFVACAQRIQNLRDNDELVILLPDVESRFTLVERVVDHMKKGWTYESI